MKDVEDSMYMKGVQDSVVRLWYVLRKTGLGQQLRKRMNLGRVHIDMMGCISGTLRRISCLVWRPAYYFGCTLGRMKRAMGYSANLVLYPEAQITRAGI